MVSANEFAFAFFVLIIAYIACWVVYFVVVEIKYRKQLKRYKKFEQILRENRRSGF